MRHKLTKLQSTCAVTPFAITTLGVIAAVALSACLVDFDKNLIPANDAAVHDMVADTDGVVPQTDGPDITGDAVTDGDAAIPDGTLPIDAEVDQSTADQGCGESSCVDDDLYLCGEFALTCTLGCVEGTPAHCSTFFPSNNIPSPGSGQQRDLTIDFNAELNSCTGELNGSTISGATFSIVTQSSGPDIGALRVRSFELQGSHTLRISGDCALAIVADQTITVAGTIDASGGNELLQPGPGGFSGGFGAIPGVAHTPAAGCGAGGANISEDDGGGGGGFGTAGGKGGNDGGAGGLACPNAELIPLVGGSGGGRGGCGAPAKCAEGGRGGGGGGALALIAGDSVTIAAKGGINLGGAGGEATPDSAGGAGGGGSGGTLLVEAIDVSIATGAIIAAGGGGGGALAATVGTESHGQNGQLSLDPAAGGQGTVAGGAGASNQGGTTEGEAGADDAKGGGGGGGGIGRVRINTKTGTITIDQPINAIVSQSTLALQ